MRILLDTSYLYDFMECTPPAASDMGTELVPENPFPTSE
jgi:hypothetical protein